MSKRTLWCPNCTKKTVAATFVRNNNKQVVYACNNCTMLFWLDEGRLLRLTISQDKKYRPKIY